MREQRRITDDDQAEHARHRPERPSWICPADGQDFPCDAYRAWVLETFRDPMDRAIHVGHYYNFAVIELPDSVVPGDIHRRFFAWTRPRREPEPVRGHPAGGIF